MSGRLPSYTVSLQALMLPDVTWLPWCSTRDMFGPTTCPPDGAKALFAALSPLGTWEYQVVRYGRTYGWCIDEGGGGGHAVNYLGYQYYIPLTRWS